MIFFSQNVVTSDNVDILLYAAASYNSNNLKIEFIIQYIDTAQLLAKKNIIINSMPGSEDLLYTYTNKINSLLKKINSRTLASLFKFDLPDLS